LFEYYSSYLDEFKEFIYSVVESAFKFLIVDFGDRILLYYRTDMPLSIML